MNSRMKVAFGIYLFLLVGVCGWNVMFAMRSEFMPYHAIVVGMPWAAVPAQLQVLVLGLMKIAGSASVVVSLSILLILIFPFRQLAPWAIWGVPGLLAVFFAGSMIGIGFVAKHTTAELPWGMPIVGLALVAVAVLLSVGDKSRMTHPA